jgi:predicted transcriptional regulator
MTESERAELDAEIEAGDQEYVRGEFVEASEFIAQLWAERGR